MLPVYMPRGSVSSDSIICILMRLGAPVMLPQGKAARCSSCLSPKIGVVPFIGSVLMVPSAPILRKSSGEKHSVHADFPSVSGRWDKMAYRTGWRRRQTNVEQDCRRVQTQSPSAANRIRSLQTTQHAAFFASPFAAHHPANPVRYDGKGGFPHDFDRVFRGRSRHHQTGRNRVWL